VHSIAINKEGVIYIGGKNEIGYLTPNSKGRLRYTWNITSGLQDGSVYYVFEDCQENLWLCLSKGILRIKDASLTFHPS
jgi:ligand-binding sensor domain-containing protein